MAGTVCACFVVGLILAHMSAVCASGVVRVQGRVLCQDCQKALSGDGTIATHQRPLQGAFVSLTCYNEANKVTKFLVGRTSKLGTFSMEVESKDALLMQCKARLLSSPSSKCNAKTNLNQGISGSIPILNLLSQGSVGPFAFTPYYCY